MEKILITGGAGFIGSNLTHYFLQKKFKVVVYDNLSRSHSLDNLKWVKLLHHNQLEIIKADIRESVKVKQAVKQAEIIFHLAGQVAVTQSVVDPREDFEINAGGTLNVLEAARQTGHKPIIVYSSTNKVYGALINQRKTISESQPLDFYSPYGCSKGAADQYMRDYGRIYNLPTVVLRQSCIYGPRQFGTEDQGWVAHFIINCLKNKLITIYGNGRQVRDILEINDLIKVYELVINNIKKCRGEVYNIGGGEENKLSLLELINWLQKKTGRKINFTFKDVRPGDQQYYVSNINKAKKELGWKPKVSKEKGLIKLYQWVLGNKKLFTVTN